MLSGASVRYRFYTRWGVTAEELSRIVFSYSVTFWLGLLGLGGLSLVVSPLPDVARAAGASAAGAGRLAADAGAACVSRARRVVRRQPLRLRTLRAAAAVARDRRGAAR